MYIACSTWIICTGGLIYVKMNNPELYGSHTDKDKHGNDILIIDSYFMKGRDQYAIEGFIASGLNTMIGLLLVMLITAPKCFRDPMFVRAYMICISGVVYFLYLESCKIYKIKNRWWNPVFEPPG